MSDLVKATLFNLPQLLALIVLLIAALTKVGKEKGSLLVLLGVLGLLGHQLITFIYNHALYRWMYDLLYGDMGRDNFFLMNDAIWLMFQLFLCGALLLIAIGILIRRPSQNNS